MRQSGEPQSLQATAVKSIEAELSKLNGDGVLRTLADNPALYHLKVFSNTIRA